MNSKKHLKKFGSDKSHSTLMLRGMVTDLVLYEYLTTTTARAKQVAAQFDKIMIYALKEKNLQLLKRRLDSYFLNKNATNKMMELLKDRFEEETGGLVRMFKLQNRKGDNAAMTKLMLKGYHYREVGGTKAGGDKPEEKKSKQEIEDEVKSQEKIERLARREDRTKDQRANAADVKQAKSRSGI